MCIMCCSASESGSHFFLHCSIASYFWNKLFGFYGMALVCHIDLHQFLLTKSSEDFSLVKQRSYVNALSTLFYGVYGLIEMLELSRSRDLFRLQISFGIGLFYWIPFGVLLMVSLMAFLC